MSIDKDGVGGTQMDLYKCIAGGIVLLATVALGAESGNFNGPDESSACVVLLHGLGRTSRSMHHMAKALEAAGYRTLNPDYDSRKFPIEHLAMQVIPEAVQQCREQGCETIHFVTHSMGGILVRYYLSQERPKELGRTVMLCPPNQGSEVVDYLRDNIFYRWYNGPAGLQLGTDKEGIASRLGPVDYPVGIITGRVHSFFDGWLSEKIPGDDDGKVSVERAKVEGMADFLAVPHPHPFIMDQEDVFEQSLHFLRTGRFAHPVKR